MIRKQPFEFYWKDRSYIDSILLQGIEPAANIPRHGFTQLQASIFISEAGAVICNQTYMDAVWW